LFLVFVFTEHAQVTAYSVADHQQLTQSQQIQQLLIQQLVLLSSSSTVDLLTQL